ncbi:hypothetical protein L596_004386 [Steinernema carpocapsae]|uniref:Uncharacterized protein n=1 Tax=Steinernema carpocapsae TaxID=34508 RepID=A0A4U8UVK6_STECR|nr:hypothetical protein L596_004386 [Steinernema carpocapsae]
MTRFKVGRLKCRSKGAYIKPQREQTIHVFWEQMDPLNVNPKNGRRSINTGRPLQCDHSRPADTGHKPAMRSLVGMSGHTSAYCPTVLPLFCHFPR